MLVWVYTWCPFSGATKLRWHPGRLSALLFLSWGERSVKAQRNTYSGSPRLWWGNGIVINFGSFSSFLLRKKPTSLWGITATGFICAQVGVFPPLVCTQPGDLQPQSLGRRWLCLLAPGRYQAAGLRLCSSSPSPLLLQLCLFLALPCPYFTFPPRILGVMLGRSQPGHGQGKAIRLLAQPTSPGPCRGEWSGLKHSLEPCCMEEGLFGPTAQTSG